MFVCLFLIILIVIYTLLNNRFTFRVKQDISITLILYIVASFYLILRGLNYYTIIYLLTIVILFLYKSIRLKYYGSLFFSIVLILGFIESVIQKFNNVNRVYGFLASSPTIFSYLISIAATFLLNKFYKNSVLTVLISIVSLLTVYLTESRSTLVILALITLYFIFRNLKEDFKYRKLLLIILTSIYFFNYFSTTFSFRANGVESNESRKLIIYYFTQDIFNNIDIYILGRGVAFSNFAVPRILGIYKTEFPLHQDILSIVVDIGFVGLLLVYLLVTYKRPLHVFTIIFIFLGSFHNIILSPLAIFLLIIFNNTIINNTNLTHA